MPSIISPLPLHASGCAARSSQRLSRKGHRSPGRGRPSTRKSLSRRWQRGPGRPSCSGSVPWRSNVDRRRRNRVLPTQMRPTIGCPQPAALVLAAVQANASRLLVPGVQTCLPQSGPLLAVLVAKGMRLPARLPSLLARLPSLLERLPSLSARLLSLPARLPSLPAMRRPGLPAVLVRVPAPPATRPWVLALSGCHRVPSARLVLPAAGILGRCIAHMTHSQPRPSLGGSA